MLLGTEFKTEHPFTIIPDDTYDHYSDSDLRDFTELENLCMQDPEKHYPRIKELFENHEHKTNFTTLYTNALAYLGKVDEAQFILEQQLEVKSEDLDLKFRLGMFYLQKGMLEEASLLINPFIRDIDNPSIKKLNETQFLNFCQFAAVYFIETQNQENLLQIYSWTLDQKFEAFNKNMAGMIASTLIKPMPEKFEDLDDLDYAHDHEIAPINTYFDHLELNLDPYHLPFQDYHDIFLDEISLQDIRKIEALNNVEELEHDVKWLLRNEFQKLQNQEGVFNPASGKFAFILASAKNLTQCLPELLATLRLPELPYFDFLFKENFFQYILNPFYHLGRSDILPLYQFISDSDNSEYTRTAVAMVLKVIATENLTLEAEIETQLRKRGYQNIFLPDQYEIIENKIPQLLKHFNDIPVDYFEDDEYEPLEKDSSFPDSIELPGGGIISKPNSLETAVFSNYMLANIEMQKEMEKYNPPTPETTAPLKPIVNLNKIGRNDPCPCGSGKKYKKCCLNLN